MPAFGSISFPAGRLRLGSGGEFRHSVKVSRSFREEIESLVVDTETGTFLRKLAGELRYFAEPDPVIIPSLQQQGAEHAKCAKRHRDRSHLAAAHVLLARMNEVRVRQIRQLAGNTGVVIGKMKKALNAGDLN